MSITVSPTSWSNIWHCPNIGPAIDHFLACGKDDSDGEYICQNNTNVASSRTIVYEYTSNLLDPNTVIGFPSTMSTQSPTQILTDGSTASNPISSNAAVPSTAGISSYSTPTALPLTSASSFPSTDHTRSHDTTPMIGLGTGIGVPFTIAVLALVAMLYRRRAKHGDRAKKGKRASNEHVERKKHSVNHRLGPAEEMADDQVPSELDHTTARSEIPTRRL